MIQLATKRQVTERNKAPSKKLFQCPFTSKSIEETWSILLMPLYTVG